MPAGTDAPPGCILSLNIRSGAGARASNLLSYLDQRSPGVVVLTEWRANAAGRSFADWATARRMQAAHQNDGGTANGVFIASTSPFTAQTVTPEGDGAGTLMLARFTAFALVGCYFPQKNAKARFFERCAEIVQRDTVTPTLLIGDLNTGNQFRDRGERAGKYFCAGAFDELTTRSGLHDLWRHSVGPDAREWSWLSNRGNGFRIDHALANDAFLNLTAPSCIYDHEPRLKGWTDHSAVLVKCNGARDDIGSRN